MNKTKKQPTEATQNTLREVEELLWRKKKLAEDEEDSLEDEF